MTRVLFVAWAPDHSRTRLLGQALGAETVFVWHMGRARGWRLLLKYLRQGWTTWRLLAERRPEAVLVQTPPVFPALLATLYALRRRGTRVILDTHSGSLLSKKWRWSLALHRWSARRAALNLLHVPSLAQQVEAWGAPTLLASYVGEPAQPPVGRHPLPPGFNVVVPSSFLPDEPVEALFEAARQAPEVNFFVTGNPARLRPELRAACPGNLSLTGYLADDDYGRLLAGAGAVLVLTTQAQTLQWGGIEAVWYGRPLITTGWADLRAIFVRGTVFVDNTPAAIAGGVREAQARQVELAQAMLTLRAELQADWQARRKVLEPML